MSLKTAPDAAVTNVFLSYSRKDKEQVERIATALNTRENIRVFKDTEDILPTEDWKKRLEGLISEADTIVFCLSPNSAVSEVCAWEVEFAESLNKRIAPLVIEDVSEEVPGGLAKLNYIHASARNNFEEAITELVKALETDIVWIREHTRLGTLAGRWAGRNRGGDLLLRGQELSAAETWLTTRPRNAPDPTEAHLSFVAESRRATTRRQRLTVGFSLAAVVISLGLAALALWQREVALNNEAIANKQTVIAKEQTALALNNEKRAKDERDAALVTQSRFLSDLSAQHLVKDDHVTAILLALEALPDETVDANGNALSNRPYVSAAELQLYAGFMKSQGEFLGVEEVRVLKGHAGEIKQVSFTPDGESIASYSYDSARLWDVATGEETGQVANLWGAHGQAFVDGHAWSLMSARNRLVLIRDIGNGKTLRSLKGHHSRITFAALSPDASRMLTSSSDKKIILWNAVSEEEVASLPEHNQMLTSAAFSPDSRLLVTTGFDAVGRLWNAFTGARIAELKGHRAAILHSIFSPDGRLILTTSSDGTARLWNAETGTEVLSFNGHDKESVRFGTFSPDGTRVVTVGRDGPAKIWETTTGRALHALKGHAGEIHNASFSKDGALLVTASRDKTAKIWDVATGALLATLAGHTDAVTWAEFSKDGRFIATGSADTTVRVWRIRRQAVASILSALQSGDVTGVAFGSDGVVATSSADNVIRLWHPNDGELSGALKYACKPDYEQKHYCGTASVAFSRDGGKVVTTHDDTSVRVWDADKQQLIKTLKGHSKLVLSATFNSDASRIVSSSQDSTARVWDTESGKTLVELKIPFGIVYAAAFSPDDTTIATASGDEMVRLWNAESGELIAALKGHRGAVTSVDFSSNGHKLVTASYDKMVRIWDVEKRSEAAVLRGHEARVNLARFSPDGKRILLGSHDGTLRIWDVSSGEAIAVLRGHGGAVLNAAFSADGFLVASASKDDTARIWKVFPTTQGLVDAAKRAVPRCLTAKQRRRFYLPDSPPQWCITGPDNVSEAKAANWKPKWPYQDSNWRDFLVARNAEQKALPPRQ